MTTNSLLLKPRPRGRTSSHSAEALLELVERVARAAAAIGLSPLPERASMPLFNSLKADMDRARGIADPVHDPERTPTAQAICSRFGKLAGHPVSWEQVLSGALRSPRERVMWLAALRREEVRDDLSDELVSHALSLVAAHQDKDTLAIHEYAETRDQLVAGDRKLHGEEAVLEAVLPTSNQILSYCGFKWENALKLAGMSVAARQHGPARKPPPQRPGLPVAQLIAIFAALNGTWPSKQTLYHFAASCNARMADPRGPLDPYREAAAALLRAEGLAVPTRTRGGGKGKRMSYRFPVSGIPGAPPRSRRRKAEAVSDGASDGRRQPGVRRRLYDEERRAFAVLSLRVWLAELPADARQVRKEYVAWQRGTGWTSANVFDKGLGGFSALKLEAADENARIRRAGGDALKDALARADAIRADRAQRAGGTEPDSLAPTRPADPEPIPFSEALRVVLAGKAVEVQPPKQ